MYHYMKRISAGILATGMVASLTGISYAKSTQAASGHQSQGYVSPSLTASQMHTVIQEANPYVHTLPNGKVTVSTNALAHIGLQRLDVAFVKSLIHTYNTKVGNGTIPSSAHPMVHRGTLTLEGDPSTGGLPYSWFTSNTPHETTKYYWWGYTTIYNNTATIRLSDLATRGGLSLTGVVAAGAYMEWLPQADLGVLISFVTGLGMTAFSHSLLANNKGFGVHTNVVWPSVPTSITSNTP